MPNDLDMREGLEEDGKPVVQFEPGDVNTPQGFEAAIAKAAGITTETAEEGTEGDGGTPEEEPATQTPPAEGAAEPGEEGDRLFAGKYKTAEDLERAYNELSQLQGRQAQQFGDRIAALERQLSESDDGGYEPVSVAPGEVTSLVEEHGGADVMQWAIENAPNLIEDVRKAWVATGDPEAIEFSMDYKVAQQMASMQPARREEPLDPALQDVALERKLTQVWSEARANDPTFDSYERGIGAALSDENTPDEIKMMLMSGNVAHMRAGVRFLTPYAKIHAAQIAPEPPAEGGGDAAQQAAAAAEAARKEANADGKRRTAIVSGSQRLAPPAGEQPGATEEEASREERIAEFKRRFHEAETTDISAGLTVNGVPVVPRGPQ